VRLLVSVSTLCLYATAAMAQPVPLWSTDESEVVPFAGTYESGTAAVLDTGDGFLVASESSRAGYAATLRLTPAGIAVRNQVGTPPFISLPGYGGELGVGKILATQGDAVLMGMGERGGGINNGRSLLVMLDGAGAVRWKLSSLTVREARFLPNGDVIVYALRNQILRLRGSDGALLWVRHLLELRPDADYTELVLPQVIGSQLTIGVTYEDYAVGVPRQYVPVYVSLDLASGATLWQRTRETTASHTFQACSNVEVSGDPVYAWFEPISASSMDVVFERRAAADGALVWATRVSDVGDPYNFNRCAFTASNALLALSARHDDFGANVIALSAAGAPMWRQSMPNGGSQPGVLALPDGRVLVARQESISSGKNGTRIEARRLSDGGVDWNAAIDADLIGWRVVGNELRVAGTDYYPNGSHLQVLSLDIASGADLASAQATASGRELLAADVEFVDGVPFAAKSALGADLHKLIVKRRDPATGVPAWTRTHVLTQLPEQVRAIELEGIPADRLLVRVDYQVATPTVQKRHALLMLDRLTGDLIWQRYDAFDSVSPTLVMGAADGSVYVRSTLCANPPGCNLGTPRLERFSAANGDSLWMQSAELSPLLVRGVDLVTLRGDNELSLLDGGNGAPFWSSVVTNAPFTTPGAVALANGDIATALNYRSGAVQKVDVERRSAANGAPLWGTRPGLSDDKVATGRISNLPGGDLLLTARFNTLAPEEMNILRPLLARIAPSTGAVAWTYRGPPSVDLYHAVRALPGGDAMRQWAHSQRFLDLSDAWTEMRLALRSIALADGVPGPEHLYERNYSEPLTAAGKITLAVAAVLADGTVQVENSSPGAFGLQMPRLERWPAAGPERGDIVVRRVGTDDPITSIGSSVEVAFDIELVNATAPVTGVRAGFVSYTDGLLTILRGCTLIGGGQCPANLDSSLEQSLSLEPGAVMRLSFEVHDRNFKPGKRPAETARGVFHVDPPYAWGDDDLGNNIAIITTALGGVSIGFE
jgi:outer membrane protein assembly factor BamB